MRNEKRKTSKKIAVAACAALAIVCAWTGGSIGLKGAANAEETATSGENLLENLENDGAFYAIKGASVKLHSVTGDDSADYNGIRFSFEMSEAQYELIASSQNGTATFNEGVIVGAYVVPVSMLSGLEEGVTPAAETIAAAAGAEHKEITADKWTKAASDAQADTQVYKSYLYVYDIPTDNMDSDLACYAYLKSGETELKTAVQVRSMQYVAKASVDAGEHTAAELERYLPYQSVTFKAEGLADSVAKVKYGASVKKPASPVKDGYTFLNWVDKDGKAYDFSAAVKENITLTAKFKAKTYGLYDFTSYDTGALANNTISGLTFTGTSSQEIVYDESEGKNILRVVRESVATSETEWLSVVFTKNLIGDFSKFDYIIIRMRATWDSTGGFVGLGGSYDYASEYGYSLPSNGTWKDVKFEQSKTIEALANDSIPLTFALYSDKTKIGNYTFEIAEIKGAYKEISIDENGINLAQKFGLAQNEFSATFTDINGNESVVADVTNFNSNVAGTLAVTVNKAGYSASTFSVSVKVLNEYGKIDFSQNALGAIPSNVVFNKGSNSSVNVVSESGYTAIKGVATGEGANVHLQIIDNSIKALANFDYITVKMKLSWNANGIIGMKGTGDSGAYNTPEGQGDGFWRLPSSGDWKLAVWRKADRKVVFDYLAASGIIELITTCYTSNIQQTLTIAEITGGYDDISTSETTLDLTKKLGLAASDFTATFTPENGVEQAVENVAAVNISAAGTLKITVKKSGYAATVLTIGVKAAS